MEWFASASIYSIALTRRTWPLVTFECCPPEASSLRDEACDEALYDDPNPFSAWPIVHVHRWG